MSATRFNIKNILQWLLKIILSGLALYLVYKKVDKQILMQTFREMEGAWLIPAIIFFNISKIFSSIRLNGLLKNIEIGLSHKENLKLYYQGMFYNLFLPGGIGGDAYKSYILNKNAKAPFKQIVGALLYDRISG